MVYQNLWQSVEKLYICAPCFYRSYEIMSKILIIDDETQIRSLLARMMELEGYEVCQAGDCKSALKQLELHSPDVALCDVFLPDGNGVDLVVTIKKAAPNTEVILLTAHGNIPDGVQAIKNGAFDYITKGDDNNKIIPLISRAVEKARMNVRLEKLEKKVGQMYSFESILGESKPLKEAVQLCYGPEKQEQVKRFLHKLYTITVSVASRTSWPSIVLRSAKICWKVKCLVIGPDHSPGH